MCAHLGWSWYDLHHSVSWTSLQKIMLDQAKVVNTKNKVEKVEFNEMSSQALLDAIKQVER